LCAIFGVCEALPHDHGQKRQEHRIDRADDRDDESRYLVVCDEVGLAKTAVHEHLSGAR